MKVVNIKLHVTRSVFPNGLSHLARSVSLSVLSDRKVDKFILHRARSIHRDSRCDRVGFCTFG